MVGIEQKYCRSGEDGCFFDKNVPALQVCSYLAYFSIIHVHASALVAESEVICDYSYNAITFIFTKQKSDFKNLGILIGMSIVQGGPGLPMLHPAVYQYMTTGKYLDVNMSVKGIPDAGVRILIDQVFLLILSG